MKKIKCEKQNMIARAVQMILTTTSSTATIDDNDKNL